MNDYIRTRGGRTIHRAECPTAQRADSARIWTWAQGRTRAEIEAATAALGVTYRWCTRCFEEDEP